MPVPITINVTGAAAPAPLSYPIVASGEIEPVAAFARFDGSAASGQFLACISYYSGQGALLSRVFPSVPVNAGDTADVTWAPGLSDAQQVAQELTQFKLVSAGSTNATSVNVGSTQLGAYYISNANAAVRCVKLYDKASAPTVGTDVPSWTLAIPGGSAANLEFAYPLEFSLGLAIATTVGVADSDATAVGANEVVVNLGFI